MQNFFGLLLDVATPIAISLFVVLPVVGIGLGVLAAWLILKKIKFNDAGLDSVYMVAIALLAYAAPAVLGGNGYLSAMSSGFHSPSKREDGDGTK